MGEVGDEKQRSSKCNLYSSKFSSMMLDFILEASIVLLFLVTCICIFAVIKKAIIKQNKYSENPFLKFNF